MKQQPKAVYVFLEDGLITLSSVHPIWGRWAVEWGCARRFVLGKLGSWLFTQLYGYVLDDPHDLLLFDKDGRYVDGWTHMEDGK